MKRRIHGDLQLRWGGRFASTRDVPLHVHEQTEIVAVTKGRCRIRLPGKVLEGSRGSLFVLPAAVAQYQETKGMTRTTYVGFEASEGLFDESARVLALDGGDPALQWIEHLCDSRLVRPPLSDEVTRAILEGLLRRVGELDGGSRATMHPAVRAARTLIEENLEKTMTLAWIARSAGVSASHLSALFAAQCGSGPLQYLQRLRLERARWLLSDPYLRIHEVAASCGYEDVNYFTRLFRQRFGVAPARWRRSKSLPSTSGRENDGARSTRLP